MSAPRHMWMCRKSTVLRSRTSLTYTVGAPNTTTDSYQHTADCSLALVGVYVRGTVEPRTDGSYYISPLAGRCFSRDRP